ncbi:uncharacterized protein LOC111364515 [Spodoptera litura]|uniref:Uncharacterized protein LOC111364515 n=1 Tax=Spodoptera litura TaxID=69820 RepID=A0A9J7EWG1_SPOLT|nr:uncharacterized protein LOC111364515 [Spodoptera litura]
MGVPGAGGAGPNGARRPSHVAYYVALVGILSLLIMLCLYFFYYFIKKVKELSASDSASLPTTSCRPPAASAYPVAPVVRDGASAMAQPAPEPRADKTPAAALPVVAAPEVAAQ